MVAAAGEPAGYLPLLRRGSVAATGPAAAGTVHGTATGPAEARLAAWLLEEAATAADGRDPLPGTQQDLGDLLGVTRVTVNRALARLRRDGLIEVAPGSVTVLAPALLGRRAAG